MSDLERPGDERPWGTGEGDDLEQSSENVLEGWPATTVDEAPEAPEAPAEPDAFESFAEPEPEDEPEEVAEPEPDDEPEEVAEPDAVEESSAPELSASEEEPAEELETSSEHAPGELEIPPGYSVLEGEPRGGRRAVGIVVSRFNGEVTGRLLDSALEELEACGVDAGSITVMPVPGAFELPLAAMALAKTRRFACVVALGCVIRGDTPHFDYVASEAASGLQLAAIETGVPVSFGVLTLDRPDQAAPRVDKGAEAVRTALEMADLFSNLRAAAAR
jgi:6,7-dimethyl-8-ribityllumazine synthase